MIELRRDSLVFTFPEVHPQAQLSVNFQRTLRIPDDGKEYPLPPGLGAFPLRHVDDFPKTVSPDWLEHGGVLLPMYQSEALWIMFQAKYIDEHGTYPFAVQVAAGKINAVTGDTWKEGLERRPQNYLVAPTQPWLDGFSVKKGLIRQFVAMPLGAGYSAEEQITGKGEYGGLQISVFPMKAVAFERHFPRRPAGLFSKFVKGCRGFVESDMGLAPGGLMKQEIYEDRFAFDDWDTTHSRCFVHIANSLVWRSITGVNPPTPPPTSKEYTKHGLPWFDYYDDGSVPLPGADVLAQLQSVAELGKKKGDVPLPENESVSPSNVKVIRPRKSKEQVREGVF
ncbi:MAG: hypothetical protein L0Y72_09220 [Gemmataceae bacterium]|nr:hypothetical protein [Gemmataceae bacterium]MCI0739212.1 hypothetical protein [Gemmataceae bacterium]